MSWNTLQIEITMLIVSFVAVHNCSCVDYSNGRLIKCRFDYVPAFDFLLLKCMAWVPLAINFTEYLVLYISVV